MASKEFDVHRLAVIIGIALAIGVTLSGLIYFEGRRSFKRNDAAIERSGELVRQMRAASDAVAQDAANAVAQDAANAVVQDAANAVVQAAVRREVDTAKLKAARERLKSAKPKTETEIVAILGEPTTTMVMPGYRMLHWYYETKEVGRDVIAVNADDNGRLSLLQY